ncbi:hypothetical protein GE09DRAFT_1060340 [Coniochaeta sp. 2T2.1]|nr:hypothetical protein GE09DRAFT_1060340 [Coniochaeta sp. 2T2.1]
MASQFGRQRLQEQIAFIAKLRSRPTAKEVTWLFNFGCPDDPITEKSVKGLHRGCQDETTDDGNEANENHSTQPEARSSEHQEELCLRDTKVSVQQEDFYPSHPSGDQLSSDQPDQKHATDHDSFNLACNIETFWHNGTPANDRIDDDREEALHAN